MKSAFIILITFLYAECFGQDIVTPKGYEILAQKVGDLNKDGIDEKVIVYNTTDTTEDGIVRELQIFRLVQSEWEIWQQSRNAIKKSQEGGMMGDPFGGIEIVKGLLVIDFNGGSSWKWSYTDTYRYQNGEFQLIGYVGNYGKLCEYWQNVNFEIVTGRINLKKEYEECEKDQQIYKRENETFLRKGILLNIQNRNIRKYKITSPKYKHELYL